MQTASNLLRAVVVVALVAGCAAAPSPVDTTTWRDPDFKGPPFRTVFVVGLSAQNLRDQRGFENVMVSTLLAAGVGAVAGWQHVPTDRPPDQATMREAIERSGADAALLVRLSDATTQTALVAGAGGVTEVSSNMYVGWYEPGVGTASYQAATIYTTLFDVASARAVWTYNPPAYSTAVLNQDAPAFAGDVTRRLVASGFLAAR